MIGSTYFLRVRNIREKLEEISFRGLVDRKKSIGAQKVYIDLSQTRFKLSYYLRRAR